MGQAADREGARPRVIHVDLTAPKAFLRIFAEKEVFPSGLQMWLWTKTLDGVKLQPCLILGIVPRSNVLGPDLQVCTAKKPTCCTKKMEERYQVVARQDMQQVLQTSSSTLKFLISRNAAAFQAVGRKRQLQYVDNKICERYARETVRMVACKALLFIVMSSLTSLFNIVFPKTPFRSGKTKKYWVINSLQRKIIEDKVHKRGNRVPQYLDRDDMQPTSGSPYEHYIVDTKTLETLIRQAENYTSILFCNTYRNMALEAAASTQELFTDVGLYLFGADVNPEEFVNRFFDSLFPLVYNHLINPGVTDSSLEYSECIRMARRDISPFGNIPKRVLGQMGRSLLPSRTFLQALNLGIEVINTTDHLHFSKECGRALLRMQYCPHCQGLALTKPCMGYCLNVLRGCLAHVAELNSHWHVYIRSLEELSDAMHGTYDIEHVLLNFHLLVNDAVMQAHLDGQKLSEQVNKICGRPVRTPTQSPRCSFDGSKEKHGMKISIRNGEETLANRRKEFINSLRLYRTFYGGLADQLCANELDAADGLPCWNGEDIVKSYTQRVVGNGIKAQSGNPEVKVKGTDPVINQIIDKLRHVIQVQSNGHGRKVPRSSEVDSFQCGVCA
ncbi:hypothetical protein MJT46_009660 [Ovis ammon polii x Ovis aries]|nr:hypothetical protein MJT46_009660 [Ovis ammon polii x Ovis aries]